MLPTLSPLQETLVSLSFDVISLVGISLYESWKVPFEDLGLDGTILQIHPIPSLQKAPSMTHTKISQIVK